MWSFRWPPSASTGDAWTENRLSNTLSMTGFHGHWSWHFLKMPPISEIAYWINMKECSVFSLSVLCLINCVLTHRKRRQISSLGKSVSFKMREICQSVRIVINSRLLKCDDAYLYSAFVVVSQSIDWDLSRCLSYTSQMSQSPCGPHRDSWPWTHSDSDAGVSRWVWLLTIQKSSKLKWNHKWLAGYLVSLLASGDPRAASFCQLTGMSRATSHGLCDIPMITQLSAQPANMPTFNEKLLIRAIKFSARSIHHQWGIYTQPLL